MKTKGNKKNKVNIITLGCAKNLVDSEVLLTQLRGNGIDARHEDTSDESSIIIVNTCGFIENAKQESIETILRYSQAKSEGIIDKLYVTGCLSERYKPDLEKEIDNVDAFFGTRELPALLKKFKADYKKELLGERLISTSSHYAFLKISEGCDRPCSFCAIPLMRGNHLSRPQQELVTEAKNLVAKGVKELVLIAQDLTYYGLDVNKKRGLGDLLKHLSDIEGLEWIRLQYAYPSGFPMDVLDVINERPNICKYLDMPLQSGSSKVLKLMRRGITREKTEELIHDIRAKVPGIAIRTTLITGHPGETPTDHKETLKFVEDMRFDRLGVFTYSHEENTHSFSMEDKISAKTKQKRHDEIMELQAGISLSINENKVGNTYKVLFDRIEGGYFVGRTEHDSPEVDNEVLVDGSEGSIRLGDFANVKINSVSEFDLYGEIVKN